MEKRKHDHITDDKATASTSSMKIIISDDECARKSDPKKDLKISESKQKSVLVSENPKISKSNHHQQQQHSISPPSSCSTSPNDCPVSMASSMRRASASPAHPLGLPYWLGGGGWSSFEKVPKSHPASQHRHSKYFYERQKTEPQIEVRLPSPEPPGEDVNATLVRLMAASGVSASRIPASRTSSTASVTSTSTSVTTGSGGHCDESEFGDTREDKSILCDKERECEKDDNQIWPGEVLHKSASDSMMASSAYRSASTSIVPVDERPRETPEEDSSSRHRLFPTNTSAHLGLYNHKSSTISSASSTTCVPSATSTNPLASSMSPFANAKRCVLKLDGYSYLIVANPPEARESPNTISPGQAETIIIRRGVQKTSSDSSTMVAKDSKGNLQASITTSTTSGPTRTMDTTSTFPPVDTVEACDKAALRLRELAQHLDHGEVPISVLKKTLQYAACVLDTVTMDETRTRNQVKTNKEKRIGPIRAPSDPSHMRAKLLSTHTTGSGSTHETHHSLINRTKVTLITDLSQTPHKLTSQWTRKLLDDEDDLSEVQPDAVPTEVREWLASTFTRNNAAQKRRSEEKPKFRSVANAIRAGIMVDKLYRRLCCPTMVQIPPKIVDKLKLLDNWSFDCFNLNTISNNQALKYLSYEVLNRYGLVHKFKIPSDVLENCLNQIEQGYTKFKNPYHNNMHAADVTQTVHFMLTQMGLVNWLTDLEVFATLLAAIIHDFQHTGTTNNFHVMSGSETALLYNDRAVLENFHVSAAFKVLREPESNILVNVPKEEYRELRTLVIDMVLATDMSSHFQQIKTMKSLLTNVNEFSVDKSKALSMVLHCCDISHPAKDWNIHRRWTELLLEEFFRQGDKEKELGLPYSPLCDRNTTLVAESQIGFIDFIVAPSLEVCGDLLDRVQHSIDTARHSSASSDDNREEILPENGSRPKSISSFKSKRGGLSIDSAEAQINSRSEGGRLKRPWLDNLEENRRKWQERAHLDAIQRAEKSRKPTSDLIAVSISNSPESEL
ncbi:phosphodiesterase 1c isoform X2 [Brevipalpus obovatus]|uniref:phosphodiesterase 1c isoform X2 n=1 Tax=Brevipalpus obovatus TaxID=246614 RepID=UPI003D9E50CD